MFINFLEIKSERVIVILFLLATVLIPSFNKIFFGYTKQNDTYAKPQGRYILVDIIKGISIISVILIHVILFIIEFDPVKNNILLNTLNNLLRFAIPLFLICSGMMLNPDNVKRKIDIIDFYRRKLLRIFIPYIIVVISIELYNNHTASDMLSSLVTGTTLAPYYFMIVLFQLYLIYPYLISQAKKRFFIETIFSISVIMFFLSPSVSLMGVPLFIPYLFFFAYGIKMRPFYLSGSQITKKELWFWISIVVFFTVFILFWSDYYYNLRFFYGLAIFNIAFYFRSKIEKLPFSNILLRFGRKSLWIYLLHFPIVFFIYKKIGMHEINMLIRIVIILFLSSVASYLVAMVLDYIYVTIKSIDKGFNTKRYDRE